MSSPPPLPPKTRRAAVPAICSDDRQRHVVSIRVNTAEEEQAAPGCVRISVGGGGPYFFCSAAAGVISSSGQSSPSDTLDSGTGSDLDGGTPPPPPTPAKVRAGSLSSGAELGDSDDDDRLSCDSLSEAAGLLRERLVVSPPVVQERTPSPASSPRQVRAGTCTWGDGASSPVNAPSHGIASTVGPMSSPVIVSTHGPVSSLGIVSTPGPVSNPGVASTPGSASTTPGPTSPPAVVVQERTYEDRRREAEREHEPQFDADVFYKFHIHERFDEVTEAVRRPEEEESFAGYKDPLEGSSTIRSAKGTVRGVKNRVRAGITTFLQLHATKSYKEKEAGKVVLYTTTLGVVRRTHQDCVKIKKILRNLMVKYEERDVFMSREVQAELKERINCDHIVVPQMFVEGQLVGDAEAIEKLNESGELRRFLKPYRSADACSECRVCGGYRLLPCPVCSGSKKSVHRNHFTAEFVALKCMNCDEVGLVRCHAC